MRIRNVLHRGLHRFIENDDPSGMPSAIVPKLRRMLAFIQDMKQEDELKSIPSWRAHQLSGDRRGVWSLSVTRNWRLTFRVDQGGVEIVDLNYEDYH